MREKVRKSPRNTVFIQWFGAPEGRKVGSLKRRVRSQLARWEMKNCTPLWREAHFQVKMCKTPQLRSTFRSCDVEKVHAICGAKHISKSKCTKNTIVGPLLEVEMLKKCTPLWREAHFQVKNVQKHTRFRATFLQLRFRKSVRRCGAKHILKSKCTKHTSFGPLLEVQMSKKCTPLWREAHFEVKMYKNTTCSRHFWRFGCRFASLHYTTLHSTTLHSTTLHYITLHCTTFHYASLHYTTLHYTTTTTTTTQLHSTTLHYTPLHSITLHYTTLHYTTLHYTTLHYTTLPSTTLHYITLHYTPLHYNYNYDYTTTLHYTQLHYTTLQLHYTTLHFHYTPLHYTTLHYTTIYWMTLHQQIDR